MIVTKDNIGEEAVLRNGSYVTIEDFIEDDLFPVKFTLNGYEEETGADGGYFNNSKKENEFDIIGFKKHEIEETSYMNRQWVFTPYNLGYELGYIEDGEVVRFMNRCDDGITHNKELIKYIVNLHNSNLKESRNGK